MIGCGVERHFLPVLSLMIICAAVSVGQAPKFAIAFPKERSAQPIDGRLLLILSTDPSAEPRMQINAGPNTQMLFGMDVEGLQPDQRAIFDEHAAGYTVRSLRDVKPGEYQVQAVLHRYETFHRADGHTVKLPMDRGEGQHGNLAPGNLLGKPYKITLGSDTAPIAILLDREIPPIPPPSDTKYVKHVRIKSEL